MTADEFRAGLIDLGFATSQSPTGQRPFALWLTAHGHPSQHVDRNVRRWAEQGPPGEIDVLFAVLRNQARRRAAETAATA